MPSVARKMLRVKPRERHGPLDSPGAAPGWRLGRGDRQPEEADPQGRATRQGSQ